MRFAWALWRDLGRPQGKLLSLIGLLDTCTFSVPLGKSFSPACERIDKVSTETFVIIC